MNYYNNINETIGQTPLVKINKITKKIPALILAKIEFMNPGHSIKDRIGMHMINEAEKSGKIKKGGTIIESTSGNTGVGLALTAINKGYKLICTIPDKMSKEKIDILKSMGVEVIICKTNVEAENPKSYYSVAKNLSKKIKNSFYVNQYDNLYNRDAHYKTTGPEIWKQTEGKITHLVAGIGTGGTISGCAKFLKEKNKNIKIWGIDTYGSLYKKYFETGIIDKNEIYPYITEGIGEDIIPENVDFTLIDKIKKVKDKDAAIMTRKLTKEEGLFVGNSSGAVLSGIIQMKKYIKKENIIVAIFPDHGSRYVNKIFNDKWMKKNKFLN